MTDLAEFTVESIAGSQRALRASDEGLATLARRAHARGKALSPDLARRLTGKRPFVGWDGEGITTDGRHEYALFGCSLGMEVSAPTLHTVDCLDLLTTVEQQHPNVYHVIFAGKYDVNMILRDCHYLTLERLHRTGRAQHAGYTLGYAPGKFFRVRRHDVSLTLFDVWAFFQSSFVKACTDYLGTDATIERIEEGKRRRHDFTWEDMPYVTDYFRSELAYLVRLMDKLRSYLQTAGLNITSWHGPGAISSLMFNQQGIKRHMHPTPPEVIHVVQHAYQGGRPELTKAGAYFGLVWQNDRNSAYPAGIAQLPSLAGSTWRHVRRPQDFEDWGIYHVVARTTFDVARDGRPYPLFWRDRHGCVYYPRNVNGWYWGVEARLLSEFPHVYGEWDVSEAWILTHRNTYPFRWVTDYYEQRRAWKAAGNPAQITIRLGLNSMYGKQAQRVGAHRGGPPAWHQLEWAGWVTAANRAELYRAMMQSPATVISCATDSVFGTAPLQLPISDRLGEWDENISTGIIVLQSGVYWLRDTDGEWHAKYRGFDKGTITPDMALAYLRRLDDDPTGAARLEAPSTRFMTWGQTRGGVNWRQWRTEPRSLEFGSVISKGGHFPEVCPQCARGESLVGTLHPLHTCGLPWIGKSMSAAHSLPWSDYGVDSMYPTEEDVIRA